MCMTTKNREMSQHDETFVTHQRITSFKTFSRRCALDKIIHAVLRENGKHL